MEAEAEIEGSSGGRPLGIRFQKPDVLLLGHLATIHWIEGTFIEAGERKKN